MTPQTLLSCAALAGLAACAPTDMRNSGMPDGGARAPRLAQVGGYAGAFLPSGELAVTRPARPFAFDEGAEAKRAANALCGGAVRSGDRDQYRDENGEGQWVFPGGCA